MSTTKLIGKCEFIKHTSKYIKMVEEGDCDIVITHHKVPNLKLSKVKRKSVEDLRGIYAVKVHGDINDHVLAGYDKY